MEAEKIYTTEELRKWIRDLEDAEQSYPEDGLVLLENTEAPKYINQIRNLGGELVTYLNIYIPRIYFWTENFEKAIKFAEDASKIGKVKLSPAYILSNPIEYVFSIAIDQPDDYAEVLTGLIKLANDDPKLKDLANKMEAQFSLKNKSGPDYSKIDKMIADCKTINSSESGRVATEVMSALIHCVENKDFEKAGFYLSTIFRIDRVTMTVMHSFLNTDPRFVEFKKTKFFKDALPEMPVEKHLAQAYVTAMDEPYETYKKLEKNKEKTKDKTDLLAVQHFCIALICSDLGEHGDDNMDEYGGGKISIKGFKDLKKKLEDDLKKQMAKSKIKHPPFWKYKKFKSFKDVHL
ncbi:MAG: hypothetical protein HYU69_08930 [Bacteroidetes bacterium]|nr:hypothetical protein [Bacteroidota bacterium]